METKRGLRDVSAGQTRLCLLDEANSELYYCGYSIRDLAEHYPYEAVAYLMLYGELPSGSELKIFTRRLVNIAWTTPKMVVQTLDLKIPISEAHPMDKLSLMIRADGNTHCIPFATPSLEDNLDLAKGLIARLPLMVALLGGASRNYFDYMDPDRTLMENFVNLLRLPNEGGLAVKLMNVAFILYAEHEFNAGSFAVRVAASAHTDIYSAVLGGVGTLRGTRHGGANEEVMKKMLEIGTPEKTREYCERFLSQPGARLPGFGHAVYTIGDPRVKVLRPLVKDLSVRKNDMRWYEIALALEEYMAERSRGKSKPLPANTDLWTAPLYHLLGIPTHLFTPLFAASRVSGWCGHYLEVRHVYNEPILRPRAEYVGSAPRKISVL